MKGELSREEIRELTDHIRTFGVPVDEHWSYVSSTCPACGNPISTTVYKGAFRPAEGHCWTCGQPIRFCWQETPS